MDYLCQADTNFSLPSWVLSSCQCDWINIVISLFSIYLNVLLIAYLRWMRRELDASYRLFKNHSLRACLSTMLFVVHWTELADAFLSKAPSHVFVVPIASFLLLITFMILEHLIERTSRPTLLLVSGSLWLANGTTRMIRVITLSYVGFRINHLRPCTAALSSTICFLISGSEFLTVNHEIRKVKESEKSVNGIHHLQSYCHDEAHFLSRATFYWMNLLLKSGYKSPIKIEDLGSLPSAHFANQLHHKLEIIFSQSKDQMTAWRTWKCFWTFMKSDFCIGGLLKFLGDMTAIVGPLGISVVVGFVADQKILKENALVKHKETRPSLVHLWQNGWTMSFIIFFASIVQSTFSQASTHFVNVKSIHLKIALQSIIYSKCLRLRASSKLNLSGSGNLRKSGNEKKADEENVDFGVFVNLMSNDATNIMSFFWIGHYIWAIPVKMAAIMFFLYMELGGSAIIGAAVAVIIVMPLQLLIGRKMSKNSSAIMELSDERLQQLSILTEKFKLFKLLGWERYYCKKILSVREKELLLLDKDSLFWAILTFFTHASSVLVSLITFGAHYLFSNLPLTSNSVFSTLALFNQLMVPLFIFPVIIPIITEAMVSCRRITEFLNLSKMVVKCEKGLATREESNCSRSQGFSASSRMTSIIEEEERRFSEISSNFEDKNFKPAKHDFSYETNNECIWDDQVPDDLVESNISSENMCVLGEHDQKWILTIENGTFAWNPDLRDKYLEVKSLKIPTGKITVVCGKVGSGKTSLLSAILGEMPQLGGLFNWRGRTSVAYCPQTPWVLNTTIRDNILFGLPFRPRRYAQVINACALKADIDILPKNDLTILGGKGISLSGGQKQRIAIARALYSTASLIILDDPLSSLDLSMAVNIFENGIRKLVRQARRTVIIVTHYFQFLLDSSLVIAMDDGKIQSQYEPCDSRFKVVQNLNEPIPESGITKEHTAKERWQLIKSVANLRRHLKALDSDKSWETLRNNMISSLPVDQFRKLFDKQSEWKRITHDLPLPTDEFHSHVVECYSSRRRRSSVRKKGIDRAYSLQYGHTKVSQVVRQYSSPLTSSTIRSLRSNQKKCQQELITEFLTLYPRESPVSAGKDRVSGEFLLKRKVSSDSALSDLFGDYVFESNAMPEGFSNKDGEERDYGKIRNLIYSTYLKACGLKTVVLYVLITLAWQIIRVNTDYWLSTWIETTDDKEVMKNLVIYVVLTIGAVIFSLISHGLGQYAGSQARRKLHDSMLLNIIESHNKFLEIAPLGNIFNRFSADVEIIDKKLATTIQRLMQFLLLCCCAIVINAVITPWFIVITIPTILLYYIIQMFYRCSSTELQRIDSMTRSPIFSHFAETLSGLPTIRAFGYEDKFMNSFYEKLNFNTNCFLILNCTNRWLGIVLDYLGGVIVLLAMITTLITVRFYPDSITTTLVGLGMNYTLLLPVYLNWVVKFFVDVEIYLGAVERIRQFTMKPMEENKPHSEFYEIPKDWPRYGDIKFENVTLSYGSCKEPVLVAIDLHIPQGQKIGICGRSGSGKSSLALSLFNMLEVNEGVIKIDDFDITKVPGNLLRTVGSIIPQDILLFNGTVKENLDALGTSTEEELWAALEKARLTKIIETHFHGNLGSEMNGGQSMSGGEKQLFSLARAILRKSSFLIMDESTSNLDKESEQILMSVAQEVFERKTLIIIAHRLSTVLDCDRIVVLEKGRIVEDGTPCSLIRKNSGVFFNMVKSSQEGFLVF